MFGHGRDSGVDEAVGGELRACFLADAFECEVGEVGERGMRGDGAEEGLAGGMMDLGDDEVVYLRNVLRGTLVSVWLFFGLGLGGWRVAGSDMLTAYSTGVVFDPDGVALVVDG